MIPCQAISEALQIPQEPIPLRLLEQRARENISKPLNCYHFFFSKITCSNLRHLIESHCYYVVDQPQKKVPVQLGCNNCPFTTDNSESFVAHIKLGPFANGHVLSPFSKYNNETLVKIISSFFCKEDELTIICNECNFVVSSLDQWEKMYNHAISHGSLIEELGLSMRQVEKKLDYLVKTKTMQMEEKKKIFPCIVCGVFFSSLTNFYAHIWLHDHSINNNFCIMCSADINTNMIEHIKLQHPFKVGKPFMVNWDPRFDNDIEDVIQQAKIYSHNQKREGFSTMDVEVLNFHASCRPHVEFKESSSICGGTFLTHDDLEQISKRASDEHLSLGKTYLPNFHGENYTRNIYPLLPTPLPPSLQKPLKSSFPGDLNAFMVEPAYKLLKNEMELFDENIDILQILNVFPANRRAYPVFFFGGDILKQMLLTENNRTINFNGSPKKVLQWPTHITKNSKRISPYQGPQPDLSYFNELEKSLFPLKDYEGLAIFELSIQHLLNTEIDQKLLAYNLARSFFFNLLRIKQLPKFIILIGSVNSLPGKIKTNGPTLCLFNAYIQQYAKKLNIAFLNPNFLGVRTLLSTDGTWKHYTSANYDQKGIFNYRGGLSKQGVHIFGKWILNYVRLAKQMADTVGIEITGRSEFAD